MFIIVILYQDIRDTDVLQDVWVLIEMLQTDTDVLQDVWVLIEMLQTDNIPHNMFITYGDPCHITPDSMVPGNVPDPTIRVCVWPAISEQQVS